jgi:WD40 repeat protein
MAVAPGGLLLALSSQDSNVTQLWDLDTQEQVWSLDGEAGALSWSPGGDRLAIAGVHQSAVRVVDAESGKDILTLPGYESASSDVAFLAGGERLASVGPAGGLQVWDVTAAGPSALHALAPSSYPESVQLSPDGSEMIVFTKDGSLERIATGRGTILGSLNAQLIGPPTYFPAASANWSRVASAEASDGRTVIRDLHTLQPLAQVPPCASPLGFSPDGSMLVLDGLGSCTPSMGGTPRFLPSAATVLRTRVIDAASGRELLDLGDRGSVAAEFNPSGKFPAGRYLAVNVDNRAIEIYDMSARKRLTSIDFGTDSVSGLAFDPQGRWLAGGTASGKAWVLDMAAVVGGADGKDALIFDKAVHNGPTAAVALSADGLLAASGAADGEVEVWDVASGRLVVALPTTTASNDPAPVQFSPDGNYLLYNDGGVLRRYLLHADQLIALARSRLTRTLTSDECHQYLSSGRCS